MPKLDLSGLPVEGGDDHLGRFESVHVGAAGGLTQFGVVIETLWPGAKSSDRHWHEEEDEFLWMLEGEPTLVENAGETTLRPGDAVALPKGVPNAHHLINRTDAPVRFLVAGWRAPRDVVHYPDRGGRAVMEGDSRTIEEGDEPGPADLPSGKLDPATLPRRTGSDYPAPYDAEMDGRSSLQLGKAGGLIQFGANLVILAPGAKSSMRHWHMHEDEFAMVTEGELILIEDDGETALRPGDCIAWPAAAENGHQIVNSSDRDSQFLVVGTRADHEVAYYSDVDMMVEDRDDVTRFTKRDGTLLKEIK